MICCGGFGTDSPGVVQLADSIGDHCLPAAVANSRGNLSLLGNTLRGI